MNSCNDAESAKESFEESLEESLDLIGFGRSQLEIFFGCYLLLLMIMTETGATSIGILAIASQCELNTNSQERAILSASVFLGLIFASHPWAYFSDAVGRKNILLQSAIATTFFSFLSSIVVSNLWVFVFLRFMTGVGVAGTVSSVYPYLGEFNTLKNRAALINYVTSSNGIANIYCAVVAWLILPQTWTLSIFGLMEYRPWRLLILFNLLPGLIGAIWIYYLPETPKLYLSHGKDKEALQVLYWIYERNTGKSAKDFQVKRLKPEADQEFLKTLAMKKSAFEMIVSMWKQTVPLFKPPHVFNYAICCFVMFGLFFSSSGMGLWFPEIQNRLGHEPEGSRVTICEVINKSVNETFLGEKDVEQVICNDKVSTKTYIDNITLGGSFIVAYIVLGFVISLLGRKTVLGGALAIAAICGFALLWVNESRAIVIMFCGYLMLSGTCVSILSGSVVELIPTHLRGKAVCICLMIGRLGSVVGNNLIGAILESNCDVTFYIFAGLIVVCSLMSFVLPI